MHPSVVQTAAPEAADELAPEAQTAPPLPKRKPRRKLPLVSLVGLILVLVLAAFLAWQKFKPAPPPPPTPRPALAKQTPPPAAAAGLPSATLNQITAAPANIAAQVQNVMEREQERVDALAAGRDPDAKPQPAAAKPAPTPVPVMAPPPVAPSAQQVTTESQTEIAPNVTATTTTIMAASEASPQFKSFVGQMQINGVFQGTPARALINGHTVREGELVEPNLGIYFDHINAETKVIIFRDRSGATVERKY